MTSPPVNAVTIYCKGNTRMTHPATDIVKVHVSDQGDVVGLAVFAVGVLDSRPLTGRHPVETTRAFLRDGHYQLRIPCPTCERCEEYNDRTDLETVIRAKAFTGVSRLSLGELWGYRSK